MPSKTLVFVPTFNERENVAIMGSQILAQGLDADLLFLDDDSPDGTGEILDRMAEADPRILVIHRSGRLGVGSAHLAGIGWAYDHGYDTLVTMDCDFTHSPDDLPRMLAASTGHDIAVASRYLRRGCLPGWNLLRRFLTHLGHMLTRRLLGMDYDATGAFRVYRLDRIPRGIFDLVTSTGYAFFFESLFLLHRNGCSITQIPIVLPARTYGHSKMTFWEPYRSLKQVLALSLTSALNPGQFRLIRPPEDMNPSLVDPQEWGPYWDRKRRKSTFLYEIVATLYRLVIIRRRLNRMIRRHFPAGSRLLHAGCGSGQVDVGLQSLMKITAVDISVQALELYRQNNPEAFRVLHASILSLPFEDGSFDGVYNLGVVEHFDETNIRAILSEMGRVLRAGGKAVIFWPHARSASVWFLRAAHWVLNDLLRRGVRFHPPEISLLRSRSEAELLLRSAGLPLLEYRFGAGDGFVQAVVVAQKPLSGAAAP